MLKLVSGRISLRDSRALSLGYTVIIDSRAWTWNIQYSSSTYMARREFAYTVKGLHNCNMDEKNVTHCC